MKQLFGKVLLALALTLPTAAFASVSLDCSTTNICLAFASSPGSPTPFKYSWSWSYAEGPPHTGVVIPAPCENRTSCTFRCPNEDDYQLLQIGVTVRDANNQLLGTGSSTLNCSGYDG